MDTGGEWAHVVDHETIKQMVTKNAVPLRGEGGHGRGLDKARGGS